jgi:ribosome-interacting GTPase 1
MPANLTPQYKKVEEQYRAATTDEERVMLLEEMLRVIPKHKGTEHLQAEIKRKLSHLKGAAAVKKSHGKSVDIFHVARGGAGQIALIGTPNSGKSSIVQALTNAKVAVADFPFATHAPVPGMAKYEDIQIQIVDMPPITADFVTPGQVSTYRNCDLIGIVSDMSADVLEQMEICLNFLDSHDLLAATEQEADRLHKQGFVIGTKSDIAPEGTLATLKEITNRPFEYVDISVRTAHNLDKLVALCFKLLKIIRIYAKPPGKPPDMKEPFTLPIGSTVMDLAKHIHRELADKLKTARAWGTAVYDGQSVQRTHILHDKDIIELHFG